MRPLSIIGRQLILSGCLPWQQKRRIRLETGKDGLCERGIALGFGQGQALLELLHGFIQSPLSGQRDPQIIVCFSIIGVELERPLEMLNGFIQPPLLGQRDP